MAGHSQYCVPLKLKQRLLEACRGCAGAARLRQATLRRGAGQISGAGGVTICSLTVPEGWAVAQAEAGVKLMRQPPRACSVIATSVEQPWQSTDAGT